MDNAGNIITQGFLLAEELNMHFSSVQCSREKILVRYLYQKQSSRDQKEGIVPFEWKEANIIPLFKKGSRNKSVNYRPVSLTSVICKLLETIIRDHMMEFLIKYKLINPSQHGFLKAKSCLTNLFCFLEEITK